MGTFKLIAAGLLAACFCMGEDAGVTFNIGGGVGVPLNPVARYAGVGGNFVTGIGENFDRHNALIGQFMWHGLPPSVNVKTQLNGGRADSNLYALTANYRFSSDLSRRLGWYLIAGGGWYYRHTTLSEVGNVPLVCSPVYEWWGYQCSGGYLATIAEGSAGTNALGGNGGVGLTLRFGDSNWKFYIESRYSYAGSGFVNTQVSPVTFGIAYK